MIGGSFPNIDMRSSPGNVFEFPEGLTLSTGGLPEYGADARRGVQICNRLGRTQALIYFFGAGITRGCVLSESRLHKSIHFLLDKKRVETIGGLRAPRGTGVRVLAFPKMSAKCYGILTC